MNMDDNRSIKQLSYVLIFLVIIAIVSYFYSKRQKCASDATVSALQQLLSRYPEDNHYLFTNLSNYMPSVKILRASHAYTRGDEESCVATLNIEVDDHIAKHIEKIKADKNLDDLTKVQYSGVINNINWFPEKNSFILSLPFNANDRKVSIGGAETLGGWIQFNALITSLKFIAADFGAVNATSNLSSSLKTDEAVLDTLDMDSNNIESSVFNTVKIYRSGGVASLASAVSECWSNFDSKLNNTSEFQKYHLFEYCASMDLASYRIHADISKSTSFHGGDFFTWDKVSERVDSKYYWELDADRLKNIHVEVMQNVRLKMNN